MYLAIDIGGSKTLWATFSTPGPLHDSVRFETPKTYPDFIAKLRETYESLPGKADLKACVAGAPGRIDYEKGTVVAFGSLPWKDEPFQRDIEAICKLPTLLENDANLAALSEAVLIQHGYKKILYLTVSTGIGGGLILDGKITPAYAGMEPGQMKFEKNGQITDWEDITSGKAIVKRTGKRASELDDPQQWYIVAHDLGLGIWNIIVNVTPDVIILGGGVGAHFEKYADQLHDALMLYSNALAAVPPIRQAIAPKKP